jgi:GTPase SAR1 family protein
MYDSLKCKVILLGDSGVGKTSIISRLINKYEKNPKSTIST